ncbi:oxidoreductase [Azorhizobium oxalatiphilum]|uniref:Oxidoreductase n=1 Tax=Azorhizobium oxalatiphilum TaxID=980631 RepID=A0A917BXL0_9HYPH|nr:PDR/VanB family oxidoreductase [Azorhizobium oxalatiphilum]GGF61767.1 oxidoreductase [Azorhizobium oxalatiphilum]
MRRHSAILTRVTAIEEVGEGVKRFTLQDPEGWELPPARPGAHLDLFLPGGLIRTYSLCGPPHAKDRYVIAVKREVEGRGGSMLLHDQVKCGDEMHVSLPRGGVPLGAGFHLFVAGGIGVTPFLSAASALLAQGRSDFRLHVMSRGTPPLADQIAPLVASGLAQVHDTTRIARPRLADMLAGAPEGASAACCGPVPMLEDFSSLTDGWPAERVHLELFVPPPLVPDPDARAYTLVLAKSGLEIEVPAGASMADALSAAGADVHVSCGGGICGTCAVTYLEGTPLHRDRCLSPTERGHKLMPCVAQSAGERLVLEL